MVQEADKEPRDLETGKISIQFIRIAADKYKYKKKMPFSYSFLYNVQNVIHTEVHQNVVVDTMNKNATRHVSAPEPKAPQSAPNQNICADCERLIV